MGRLFTIGDSISQGFMSASAARTEQSYSTILAKVLGLKDYKYLVFGRYQLKCDIERIFRVLELNFGTDIRGLEWIQALQNINGVLNESEHYFERGEGKLGKPIKDAPPYFDNCAVEGMDVGDAWMVTPAICREKVNSDPNRMKNSLFGMASEPFYRNAYRVLNPQAREENDHRSAIGQFGEIAKKEGVENLLLWLGANNALGTILDLEIRQSPGDGKSKDANRRTRSGWNLWHPNDFAGEYSELLEQVMTAMSGNLIKEWRVFVGTIPLVTIAPLLRGFGEERIVDDPRPNKAGKTFRYYSDYTYYPLSDKAARSSGKILSFRDAKFIDTTIMEFNVIIEKLLKGANDRLQAEGNPGRFHLVDTSNALTEMAWKRNSGMPTYQYPKELAWLYPPPDTKYYSTTPNGKITGGGIFSLDGVHPTALTQGLIAWEFQKVMLKVGVPGAGNPINWTEMIQSDTLWSKPIRLMHEIHQHDRLVEFLVGIYSRMHIKD